MGTLLFALEGEEDWLRSVALFALGYLDDGQVLAVDAGFAARHLGGMRDPLYLMDVDALV